MEIIKSTYHLSAEHTGISRVDHHTLELQGLDKQQSISRSPCNLG